MIVVTGAHGMVGRALREVLAQGRRPWRAVVRRELAADDGPVETLVADVTDGEAAARALRGATAVIHLAGVAPGMRPGRADDEVAAMRTLVAAARDAKVERFIFLSASGASPRSPHAWSRAKGEAEELLRASGLPSTILRAGFVFAEDARPLVALVRLVQSGVKLKLPLLRAGRLYPVAAGDVAIALATALDHHQTVGRAIELGAPPALALEQLLEVIARRIQKRLELGRLPFAGVPLADALAQVPGAALSDAESWTSRFAISEAPDLGDYQRMLPMRRTDLIEELRTYPWGAPPPRPGDPLPVFEPQDATGLPLFMPGDAEHGGRAAPGRGAARFGRVDPFGRIEDSGDSTPSKNRGQPGE